MNTIANRALWWQFPSLTDEPLGPWSRGIGPEGHSRVQLWRRAADWMAELGVTHFIGVLESPLKGAGHDGCPDWPFHYVCSWSEFAGARMFPESMLEEYRKEFRQILGYLRKRGIQPFLHSYNHFVPYNWFKNQEDLIAAKMANGSSREEVLQRPASDLARSVCANAESYRTFMRATWTELFDRLPELEGLLITEGEAAYCPCPACSGGVPRRERWDHILTPEWVGTMAGFAELYAETLKACGKRPLIRCYHGGGDRGLAPAMPKEVTYLIKYSGFQAMDTGPDPICHYWLNEGHDLWFVHAFCGQENLFGSLWINPEHCFKVVERGGRKPVTGQVAFYNDFLGRIGMAYPGMEINEEAGLAAMRGESYDEAEWEALCAKKLGPNGPVYLRAGKLLSQSILNMDKVVSFGDDGNAFVFDFFFTGTPKFPGTIGETAFASVNAEAHPWRGGPAPLRRFKDYLLDHPWSDTIHSDALKPGEADPVAFWDDKVRKAEEGLGLIEALDVSDNDPHFATHELMLNASRWIYQWSRFWQGFIRGKVHYWGANGIRTPIETQRELARCCLRDLEQAVDAVFVMKSLWYRFPALYTRWGRYNYYASMESKVAHYRGILEEVAAEFEPLLSGRYYQWPDGGTWTWPELKGNK